MNTPCVLRLVVLSVVARAPDKVQEVCEVSVRESDRKVSLEAIRPYGAFEQAQIVDDLRKAGARVLLPPAHIGPVIHAHLASDIPTYTRITRKNQALIQCDFAPPAAAPSSTPSRSISSPADRYISCERL